MKRLIRKAFDLGWHDTYNRDAALAYINGKVYKDFAHSGCVSQHMEEKGLDTSDFFSSMSFIGSNDEKIAFAHLVENPKMGEPAGVYIDFTTLKVATKEEVINAFKNEYPDLSIYDEQSVQTEEFNAIN